MHAFANLDFFASQVSVHVLFNVFFALVDHRDLGQSVFFLPERSLAVLKEIHNFGAFREYLQALSAELVALFELLAEKSRSREYEP